MAEKSRKQSRSNGSDDKELPPAKRELRTNSLGSSSATGTKRVRTEYEEDDDSTTEIDISQQDPAITTSEGKDLVLVRSQIAEYSQYCTSHSPHYNIKQSLLLVLIVYVHTHRNRQI